MRAFSRVFRKYGKILNNFAKWKKTKEEKRRRRKCTIISKHDATIQRTKCIIKTKLPLLYSTFSHDFPGASLSPAHQPIQALPLNYTANTAPPTRACPAYCICKLFNFGETLLKSLGDQVFVSIERIRYSKEKSVGEE